MTPEPVYSASGADSLEKALETSSEGRNPEFERKTMRSVDWRLVPVLSTIYSIALIDRVNLGSAYTAGMGRDLHLAQGGRFNLIILIFFIPYTLLQLPGNLLLRKFGVRNWLAFIVIGWGTMQLCMGFVTFWPWLVFCRFWLGAFEASLFSSIMLVMSTWYKRHEVQLRIAVLTFVGLMASGIGPILAYGCSLLAGSGNLAGWAWIFIIEGVITLVLGVVGWFLIPSFPHQNHFLTPEQTQLVLGRIDEDRGDAIPDDMTTASILTHLRDWTLWAHGIMLLCLAIPIYSIAYFLPIILSNMGWSNTRAILLSAPPYGAGAMSLFVGYYSDKYQHRSTFIAVLVLVSVIGISLLAFGDQNAVRYLGAFLTIAGYAGYMPGLLAYAANNVVSHNKRSVQTAVQISLGGLGGIIGTVVFRPQDAPRFMPGLGTSLGSQVLLLVVLLITTSHFARMNKLMKNGKLENPLEGQPGFYYTL